MIGHAESDWQSGVHTQRSAEKKANDSHLHELSYIMSETWCLVSNLHPKPSLPLNPNKEKSQFLQAG